MRAEPARAQPRLTQLCGAPVVLIEQHHTAAGGQALRRRPGGGYQATCVPTACPAQPAQPGGGRAGAAAEPPGPAATAGVASCASRAPHACAPPAPTWSEWSSSASSSSMKDVPIQPQMSSSSAASSGLEYCARWCRGRGERHARPWAGPGDVQAASTRPASRPARCGPHTSAAAAVRRPAHLQRQHEQALGAAAVGGGAGPAGGAQRALAGPRADACGAGIRRLGAQRLLVVAPAGVRRRQEAGVQPRSCRRAAVLQGSGALAPMQHRARQPALPRCRTALPHDVALRAPVVAHVHVGRLPRRDHTEAGARGAAQRGCRGEGVQLEAESSCCSRASPTSMGLAGSQHLPDTTRCRVQTCRGAARPAARPAARHARAAG